MKASRLAYFAEVLYQVPRPQYRPPALFSKKSIIKPLVIQFRAQTRKQLWTVEQTFRTAEHLLQTRPIFQPAGLELGQRLSSHVPCQD